MILYTKVSMSKSLGNISADLRAAIENDILTGAIAPDARWTKLRSPSVLAYQGRRFARPFKHLPHQV